MRIQNMRRIIGAGVFTLALAAVPFAVSASAQSNTGVNTSAPTSQTTRVAERDNGTDYGWVGLLGLAGLAGLLRKPKQVVVDRADNTMNRARAA